MAQQNTTLATKKADVLQRVETRIDELVRAGKLHFPRDYSPQNALQAAWLKIQDTKDKNNRPVLEVCTQASIGNALLYTVSKGLNPGKNQIYYIANGTMLTAMPSYFGAVLMAKRHGMKGDPFAEVVYADDEFEYSIDPISRTKTVTKHVQALGNVDYGKIVAAYAVALMDDGSVKGDIMTLAEIKASWKRGQLKGEGQMHKDHTAEACRRTVINRLCKMINNASDDSDLMLDGITADEEYYHDAQAEVEENQATEVINIDPDTGEVLENEPELEEASEPPQEPPVAEQTTLDGPGF
jgi:recombination protein RecT